ncbi:hypothetical protein PVAP13_3NG211400 [Panicum virgatum]|nr:hypothetical protein PVAP13_3NG221071 [Panicum virgatum]KAG2620454.1 hypothetical protein PVAP13_3NG221071 [Panicum virgatum]KAG2620595.1 hypothetical protein PVAP13_3NG211400 [Panicum virgatum]KAG2620598.1 hypothetical protein PVAP13_3NG211400 [Panicum virgatum]KAG2620604.1 hypothetical protein PVAP13_3NG211400 [Panicum virgatum]
MECRPRKTSSCQTKVLVGKDVFNELEQRRSSPSVIAKLMGIEVLPPSSVVHSWPQEFKDVFEVSEEPPEAVTRERSHHFPKGLPSLKQRALRLKKLMPSKTLCRDDTHDCHVECTDGLIHLNSVEINNPLFEKRPHDMNYYANYQYERDTSSVCRTYPVGLANSSLSNLRLLSRAKSEDFNSIVVLEPCLEKGHHPEKVFSIPYLSPVNMNCRRGMKHMQSEYPVMENGRVQQHLLGTEDINAPRIRKERFLASDSTDPLQIGQEASFHQFSNTDVSCSGSSQRYSCDNDSFRQTNSNRSSSDSTLSKIRRHAESAVGSKTLAEMFALSDSERLKLNSNSHSLLRRNKIDHDNGHSKDGCFIVLPKHAPLLSVRSSMDRNSCLEGSSQGKNNPNISNSYNNGKCQFHSFQDKPRLCKEIGNGREVNLRNASCFQNLMADNFSSPDCSNEKVLFTTDEGLVQQRAESEASGFNLQFSRKQRVTRLPFHCHDFESISVSDDTDGPKSCKGLKEVEQPSPVSILEPPTDEDSCFSGCFNYDLQEMAKKQGDDHQNYDEPDVSMSSDDEDHSAYQSLEAFQVEEDRDFSYLLDILICSGIIIADWQLICKSRYSPGCPVGPHVFDRLERKYNKIATWAKPERRLLFDLVNSILSEILAPCVDVHPWVQHSRHGVPLWGPEGPVEKVWQTIVRQREDCVTGHPDDMVLDTNWLEVGNDINMVGKQIARMLYGDLLEEIIVDLLLKGLVVS